jgi:integrase
VEKKKGVLLRPKAPVVPAAGKRHPAISSLDKRLARLGKTAFPRLETSITPYTLRHALAAGAKAEGYDRDDLARLLGHASTRTASGYGATGQGKRRSQRAAQILEVRASRVPRLTHRRPPGHGLEQLRPFS